jgi:serine/threonine protein phosphatase PrpC
MTTWFLLGQLTIIFTHFQLNTAISILEESSVSGILHRLFGKKKASTRVESQPSGDREKTLPLPADQPSTMVEPPTQEYTRLEPPQFIVGCGQSVGRVRDHNEDALFTLTTTLVGDSTKIPFGFYIVADGMGGHVHGEMASGVATRAMASHVIRNLYTPLFNLFPNSPERSMQEIMQEGVQAAHRAIKSQAPGGGTTLTAMLILGDQLTIAHVGDSRAYLVQNDGRIEVLTRDHSLVKRLEELGQITAEEAAVHPQRNVLYRALGQGEPFEAEISTSPVPASGDLFLCSDGLWSMLSEPEMYRIISETKSPAEASQKLVAAANAAGGPDNITAILIHLSD